MKVRCIDLRAVTLMGSALFLFNNPVMAQDKSSKPDEFGAITVTAPRVEKSLYEVPAAISKVGKDDIQLGTQQLAIDEALKEVPGVFILNRYNFAQDTRIAIRGFGARADFGIRGIKLFVDGIPATTPDGQGGVDGIDFGSAESIEVIRGPASTLYGTAAGGVISITTEDGPAVPFAEARYTVGEFDMDKAQFKFGGDNGPLNYIFSASRLNFEGYRDHNKTESIKLNSKVRYDFDSTSSLTTVFNAIDIPIQDDPGGLTAAEVAQDRRQARDRNLLFDGGEQVEQQKLGLVYRNELVPGHEITLRNYYVFRDFANKLPFEDGGQVAFDRFFFGVGAQYTFTGKRNQLTMGFDIDVQKDDRQNFDNINGARGPLALNQEEDVNSYGIFIQDEFQLLQNLALSAGIRFDRIEFDVTDKFFADGNDTGSLEFNETSPMVGFSWEALKGVNVYGNVSTSFETPTTTEFDDPTGGGFNQALEPQTATSYEMGVKGALSRLSWPTRYEITLFTIDIEDSLVPFQLEAFPDREFFRNAGESKHQGLETVVAVEPLQGLTTKLMYTYSDFEFERFNVGGNNLAGNQIPGIPRHFGNIEIEYFHPSGFYANWNTQLIGSLFADDQNTTKVEGYGVSDFRMGMERAYGNWTVSPFMGVNNLFDKEYNANIRINAFGGRFFEPAPERNFYAGMSVGYNF